MTQVRGHNGNTFDIVCLRLRTYMCDNDPLLCDNFAEVQKRLEAIHAEKVLPKNARDCCRLQKWAGGQAGAQRQTSQTKKAKYLVLVFKSKENARNVFKTNIFS